MTFGSSRESLISYLKRDVEVGNIPINTGLSRMASVRKVLSVLSDQEAEDVTALDVDAVMRRFLARCDHKYSLASQVSYKSRLRSALADFKAARSLAADADGSGRDRVEGTSSGSGSASQSIQIPLARGWTVVVDRLPIDLTRAEAERIAGVVHAYAMDD